MDIEDWYDMAQSVCGPLIGMVSQELDRRSTGKSHNAHLNGIPVLALHQLVSCLDIGGTANERGYHGVAIALTRLSIETLTVIELGLIDPSRSTTLLSDWDSGRRSQGQIRRELESHIWPGYGTGLWNEPWAEFAGTLARAVQPYAHYTPELLQWQLITLPNTVDGHRFVAGVIPGQVDAVKGHRISLLHALALWSLGRILFSNNPNTVAFVTAKEIDELGVALARSRLLVKKGDWSQQMWPHMFLK